MKSRKEASLICDLVERISYLHRKFLTSGRLGGNLPHYKMIYWSF